MHLSERRSVRAGGSGAMDTSKPRCFPISTIWSKAATAVASYDWTHRATSRTRCFVLRGSRRMTSRSSEAEPKNRRPRTAMTATASPWASRAAFCRALRSIVDRAVAAVSFDAITDTAARRAAVKNRHKISPTDTASSKDDNKATKTMIRIVARSGADRVGYADAFWCLWWWWWCNASSGDPLARDDGDVVVAEGDGCCKDDDNKEEEKGACPLLCDDDDADDPLSAAEKKGVVVVLVRGLPWTGAAYEE
mmetsp:Transcript_32214/g.102680  ORF Transcript_32214/g.102680 Transcript_32214/m.102680 type:complete len:250 (+) Transcript_32214:463-1212(+)